MAKSRKRGGSAAARRQREDAALAKARDAIFDMEEPRSEIGALLWAFDLMGAGMRGRGDDENGYAVAIVADCARLRLDRLRKHWNTVFKAGIGKAAG